MKLKDYSSFRKSASCSGRCAHPESSNRCILEMPTRVHSGGGEAAFLGLGFRRIKNVTVDAIYALTELPEGWTHGPSVEEGLGFGYRNCHSIFDDKRRVRVHTRDHADFSAIEDNIFPEVCVLGRYTIKDEGFPSTDVYVLDRMTGERLFTATGHAMSRPWDQCKAFLDEKFPEWLETSAYWD
jgi:hypothetical protein